MGSVLSKRVILFSIGILLLIVSSCRMGDTESADNSSLVTITLGSPSERGLDESFSARAATENVPSEVISIQITVSAADMDTIEQSFEATPGEPAVLSLEVPSGPERTFTVEAFDSEGSLQFNGSVTIDIEEEETTFTISLIYRGPGVVGYFLFLANWQDDSVVGCVWDPVTGSISIGTPVPFTDPHGIGVHPDGRTAYIATFDFAKNTVTNASIDKDTGQLTLGTTTVTGTKPTCILVHPDFNVAYVTSMVDDEIWVHSVNEDGTLGAGSAIATPAGWPHALSLHPNGEFLYVANEDTATQVQIFSVNQGDGSLSYEGNHQSTKHGADGSVASVSVHPNGLFLYVTYADSVLSETTCLRFTVDPATGLLSDETELLSEAWPANRYESVCVGPFGNYLYINNWNMEELRVYSIDQLTGDITYKETYNAPGYFHTGVTIGKITIWAAGT